MRFVFILFIALLFSFQSSFGQALREDSLSRQKRFSIPSDTAAKTQAEEIQQLKKDILTLDRELSNTQLNLSYYHKEYRTGTYFKVAGAAVFVLGLVLATTGNHHRTRGATRTSAVSPQAVAIPLIGALSFITGEVLCIHSHKYVGKSGKRLKKMAE